MAALTLLQRFTIVGVIVTSILAAAVSYGVTLYEVNDELDEFAHRAAATVDYFITPNVRDELDLFNPSNAAARGSFRRTRGPAPPSYTS